MIAGPIALAGFIPPPETGPIVRMEIAIIAPVPRACTSFGALLSRYRLIKANWKKNAATIST